MSAAAKTRIQIGIQSSFSTPVAATRILYGVAGMPNEDDNHEVVTQSRPNFGAVHDVLETHKSATWKYEEVFNFDEYAYWMHAFVNGNISPSGVGPYTWVANSEDTNDLDFHTLEVGDDVVDVRAPGLIGKSWEISGSDGHGPKPVMFKADFLAQEVQDMSGGLTTGLSDRDLAGAYGLFKNTAVYLDDAAGGIGTTAIGSLMAFSLKQDMKPQPNWPGNQGGIYTSYNRDKSPVEVMIDLLLDATSYAEFYDHYRDGDARFGQLKISGSGTDAFTFNFKAAKWHKAEFKRANSSRRVLLMCQPAYDATLGYAWQKSLVNGIATVS